METFLASIIFLVIIFIGMFMIFYHKPSAQNLHKYSKYQRRNQDYQQKYTRNKHKMLYKQEQDQSPQNPIDSLGFQQKKSTKTGKNQRLEFFDRKKIYKKKSISPKRRNLNIKTLKCTFAQIKQKKQQRIQYSYDIYRQRIESNGQKFQSLKQKQQFIQPLKYPKTQDHSFKGPFSPPFHQQLSFLPSTPKTPVNLDKKSKIFVNQIPMKEKKLKHQPHIEQTKLQFRKPKDTPLEKQMNYDLCKQTQPDQKEIVIKQKEQVQKPYTPIFPFQSKFGFSQHEEKPDQQQIPNYEFSPTKSASNSFLNFNIGKTTDFSQQFLEQKQSNLFQQKLDQSEKTSGLFQFPIGYKPVNPQNKEVKKENPSLQFKKPLKLDSMNFSNQSNLFTNPPKMGQSSQISFFPSLKKQKPQLDTQKKLGNFLASQQKSSFLFQLGSFQLQEQKPQFTEKNIPKFSEPNIHSTGIQSQKTTFQPLLTQCGDTSGFLQTSGISKFQKPPQNIPKQRQDISGSSFLRKYNNPNTSNSIFPVFQKSEKLPTNFSFAFGATPTTTMQPKTIQSQKQIQTSSDFHQASINLSQKTNQPTGLFFPNKKILDSTNSSLFSAKFQTTTSQNPFQIPQKSGVQVVSGFSPNKSDFKPSQTLFVNPQGIPNVKSLQHQQET